MLIVDFDPQGNSTSGIGVDKEELSQCIYDALLHDVPAEELIHDTVCERVFIIPATIQLAGAEIELVSAMARETRLKDLLEPVKDEFDFIFIDCPPSLGPVSYTHLDVYKRQRYVRTSLCSTTITRGVENMSSYTDMRVV